MNRRCWTGTVPSRRQWPGHSSLRVRGRSTGCWWTRGTGHRWKSAGQATGSPKPCGPGCGCGTANARSLAAATTPWTTTPTTSSPGPTAAPPESATWDSPAQNTTNSATPPHGNPPPPPRTNHPAGPHPPAATTKANTRTGNHHAGRIGSGRTESGRAASTSFAMARPPGRMPLSGSCGLTPDGLRVLVLLEKAKLVRCIHVLARVLVAAVNLIHKMRMAPQEPAGPGVTRHRCTHGVAQGGVDDQGMPAAEPRRTAVVGITTAVRGRGDPPSAVAGQQAVHRFQCQARLVHQRDQEMVCRVRGLVAE